MKKTVTLLVGILTLFGAYSQSITKFDKKITYTTLDSKEQFKANLYVSTDRKVMVANINTENSDVQMYASMFGFHNIGISEGRLLFLSPVDLEGNIGLNNFETMQGRDSFSMSEILEASEVMLHSMGKKAKYNGFDCELYRVVVQDKQMPEQIEEVNELCFCIDTKHKVNNTKTMFPGLNVSGLWVALVNDKEEVLFQIEKLENVDVSLKFDFETLWAKSQLLKQQREAEELKKDEIVEAEEFYDSIQEIESEPYFNFNDYQDPICSWYEFFENLDVSSHSFYSLTNSMFSVYCRMLEQDADRTKVVKLLEKQTNSLMKELKKQDILKKEDYKNLEIGVKEYLKAVKKYKPTK